MKNIYLIFTVILVFFSISLIPRLFKNKEKAIEEFEEFENFNYNKATFAGGCFWGVEKAFEETEGVVEAISGYSGGETENPTYNEVSTGKTGHYESVRVYYDPKIVSYEKLLSVFWSIINPTQDTNSQYRNVIFYANDNQKAIAEKSKDDLEKSGKYNSQIVTPILPIKNFYPAEKYHQNYFTGGSKKKSCKSCSYSLKNLTDLQYKVTQENNTETPFNNEYWDNKKEGVYVDVVSGEPLFSSNEKFESGTGWPSFYDVLETENIVTKRKLDGRTEVRSKKADSHLGHLFNDGPEPTGKRYCINSASLEFIPKEELEEKGYEEYLKIFE